VHLKPPAEWTKPVEGLKAPPPVRKTAPVGAPAMLGALKPKPVLGPDANAEDDPSRTTRDAAATAANAYDSFSDRMTTLLGWAKFDSWTFLSFDC
jgi:hypothetical protein